MPTNEPRSEVSRDEQAAVRRKLEEAVEILKPVRQVLQDKGFVPTLEANEHTDTITLTLVVHTKWPTPTALHAPDEPPTT